MPLDARQVRFVGDSEGVPVPDAGTSYGIALKISPPIAKMHTDTLDNREPNAATRTEVT